ncbi:unnamed protein product [Discosporangium mesarthrocarpum]
MDATRARNYVVDPTTAYAIYPDTIVMRGLSVNTTTELTVMIFKPDALYKDETLEMAKFEIETMSRVGKHPNIVGITDVLISPVGEVFTVMNTSAVGDLFDAIASVGRFEEETARKYARQLVDGVEQCHVNGVIHRDLKLENIYLDRDGNVKICGFGLAANFYPHQSGGEAPRLKTVCGTLEYVAPEVFSANGYDGKAADVWALGIIVYVMLAGFLPFHSDQTAELIAILKRGDFSFTEDMSMSARSFLTGVLSVDPRERLTIPQIRAHCWFQGGESTCSTVGPDTGQATDPSSDLPPTPTLAHTSLNIPEDRRGSINNSNSVKASLLSVVTDYLDSPSSLDTSSSSSSSSSASKCDVSAKSPLRSSGAWGVDNEGSDTSACSPASGDTEVREGVSGGGSVSRYCCRKSTSPLDATPKQFHRETVSSLSSSNATGSPAARPKPLAAAGRDPLQRLCQGHGRTCDAPSESRGMGRGIKYKPDQQPPDTRIRPGRRRCKNTAGSKQPAHQSVTPHKVGLLGGTGGEIFLSSSMEALSLGQVLEIALHERGFLCKLECVPLCGSPRCRCRRRKRQATALLGGGPAWGCMQKLIRFMATRSMSDGEMMGMVLSLMPVVRVPPAVRKGQQLVRCQGNSQVLRPTPRTKVKVVLVAHSMSDRVMLHNCLLSSGLEQCLWLE